MNISSLMEGMWAGDLTDLIQPLVSIDEYQSKLDDTAIVVGCFVGDKDAADDLNRFIQKSPIGLLDSDVSPAPDQRGYYMVFVELPYNERAISNITSLLEDISLLAKIETWNMKVRGSKDIKEFDGGELITVMKLNQIKDKITKLTNNIKELKKKL